MKLPFLSLALILALIPIAKAAAAEADRPNILYFYVDDMGWGSIGPNGQAERRAAGLPSVRTPNIDQLAEEGINFTRGYGCHVCSPARSSQQTGFHQGHTFADDNDPNNAKKAMRADDITMGDALSAAGYVTGYWGKWGYGGSADKVDPTIDNVQTLPTSHGYQHVLAELHHVRAHTFFQPTLWCAPASPDALGGIELVPNSMAAYQNNADYPSTPALQNDPAYPETAYCDDAYAFAALDFVRTQGQNYNESGQPFFGLLACQIPHAPFGEIASLPEWNAEYANDPLYADLADQTRQWAAMVTRIDAHFGNILAALEDPNNDGDTSDSIVDDTLVIFQSDNGGPGGPNNVELDANGGLSGNKGRIQEGGIRVPLVMRWPSKITSDSALKAGTNCDRVVDVTDLLPTFCDLAGVDAPLGIDGVSIAPTLCGEGHQRHREFIIHEAGNGESIIRGSIKLVQSKNGDLSLFDLEADHAEENDIAADNSELVEELHELLIGERVLEPRGFANTYHEWIGENGGDASDPANWSDYVYENAGITYMTDEGAPQLSWVARVENTKEEISEVRINSDLEFLGLEIRGNSQSSLQIFTLSQGTNLTSRNEIRLASNGGLLISGGTVSTLRWIDVLSDAALFGSGVIDGDIYNNGTLNIYDIYGNIPKMKVSGNYHHFPEAICIVPLANEPSLFSIGGDALLEGELLVMPLERFQPEAGQSYTLLTAERVAGKFNNPNDEVVAQDGTRFTITYTDTEVILTAK